VRKVYHLLALGLFVPVFFWDLQLLGLSLAIAFAALVLLEVLRCLRLPLLGRAVQQYMQVRAGGPDGEAQRARPRGRRACCVSHEEARSASCTGSRLRVSLHGLPVRVCVSPPLFPASQKFVDERDAGVIYITHFTLLLGLAVPIWLVLAMPDVLVATQAALHEQGCQPPQDAGATAAAPARGVWCEAGSPHCSAPPQLPQQQHGALVSSSSGGSCELGASQLLAGALGIGSAWHSPAAALALVLMGLSGTIIIGVGDTAASLFGQLFGRRPIHAGSKKTVEGTVAGIVLSLGSWLLLLHAVGLLPPLASARGAMWAAQLMAATVGAGLLEAATSQLDNILLPLWYAPHVLLIG
jgi:dolichol kinase